MHEKKILTWEVPIGTSKKIEKDVINLALNHPEWSENKILLVLLSIEKYYFMLPKKIQTIIDKKEFEDYDVLIQEIEGLPLCL